MRVGTGTAHTELVDDRLSGKIHLEGEEAHLRGNPSDRLDGYFVDSASGNLAPTREAHGAIDQGVPTAGAIEDISGRPRVGRPDVGASERRETERKGQSR